MITLLVIIAAVAPAIGLLYFVYTKDKLQQEPVPELLKAFGYGVGSAFLAMLVALPLSGFGLVPSAPVTAWDHFRVAVFGAGIPEELCKFLMLMQFLRRCKFFDEYMDGIVYTACIGLGFAALENILYLFQNFAAWPAVGAMRALVSVPGHFFFAVVMGYYVSKAFFDHPSGRVRNLVLSVVVPMLLHSLFDALLMISTVSAAAAGLIALFAGLYFFMLKTSRKLFNKHLAKDEAIQKEAEEAAIAAYYESFSEGGADAQEPLEGYRPMELSADAQEPLEGYRPIELSVDAQESSEGYRPMELSEEDTVKDS